VIDGDVIRYFSGYDDDDSEKWLRATVQPMYLTQQRLYPTFYNVLNERGEELSVELLPGRELGNFLMRTLGNLWEMVNGDQLKEIVAHLSPSSSSSWAESALIPSQTTHPHPTPTPTPTRGK
jgi:hypothetical protein